MHSSCVRYGVVYHYTNNICGPSSTDLSSTLSADNISENDRPIAFEALHRSNAAARVNHGVLSACDLLSLSVAPFL